MASMRERKVDPIMRLPPQLQVVDNAVPIPRTSISNNSPCCQGMLPVGDSKCSSVGNNLRLKRWRRLTDSRSVESDVNEHGGQNERGEVLVQSSFRFTRGRETTTGVEREVVESDGCDYEGTAHAGNGPTSDSTTTHFIDDDESDESEGQAVSPWQFALAWIEGKLKVKSRLTWRLKWLDR